MNRREHCRAAFTVAWFLALQAGAVAHETGPESAPVAARAAACTDAKMADVVKQVGAGFEIQGAPAVTRNVLMGLGSSIRYRARVETGAEYVVAFGFIETFYARTGQRVMELKVEGADPMRYEIVEYAARKVPAGTFVQGTDANNDGWLEIEVGPHADAVDRNPTLAALWVFARGDWDAHKMTAEQVLTGVHDAFALHAVDCGAPGSLKMCLSFDRRAQSAGEALAGLSDLASNHPEVIELTRKAVEQLHEDLKEIESLHAAGQFHDLVRVHTKYKTRLAEAREAAEISLAAKYKPAMTTPAQTHMANPWGALVRIRQEDTLTLNLEILPKPKSLEHKYHPSYAARDPLGWIEILTNSAARRDSTALGIDYDLGLREIAYDPIVTRYRYADGEVAVQTLDEAGVRVSSPSLELDVNLDPSRLRLENGLLAGSTKSVHDAEIHYAVVFKNKNAETVAKEMVKSDIACTGFTVLWADSAAELGSLATRIADWETSQKAADRWAERGTSGGRVKGLTDLENRARVDRRTFLSMVFQFGGVFAALDGSYESIWVRDTTNVVVGAALSGDPQYLKRWAPYLLANPTPVEHDGKKYMTFIIAPYDGQSIFKMEDDGPFYAALSAYAYWKLLGDDQYLATWYETLESAISFLDASSFKEEMGLYSERLINEAPLKDSPYWKDEKVLSLKIGDDWPMRVHSIYVNNLMYASHLMMAEFARHLGKTSEHERHLDRAEQLAAEIEKRLWNPKNHTYWTGIAIMEDGRQIPLDTSYHDIFFDYAWAFSLFPITPHTQRSLQSVDAMVSPWLGDSPADTSHAHVSIPFGHAACVYAWGGMFAKAKGCLQYVADLCQLVDYNPTMRAVYAMRGSMPEWNTLINCHRPQVFSSGPSLNAIVSLGASVDFNGVNLMPSGFLQTIDELSFKNAVLDIDLDSKSPVAGLVVDGVQVPYTLRIPSSMLTAGNHSVGFLERKAGDVFHPLLLHTNLELLSIGKLDSDNIEYLLKGFGNGVARFEQLARDQVDLTDESGKPVPFDFWSTTAGDSLRISLRGQTVRLRVKPVN